MSLEYPRLANMSSVEQARPLLLAHDRLDACYTGNCIFPKRDAPIIFSFLRRKPRAVPVRVSVGMDRRTALCTEAVNRVYLDPQHIS